MISITCRACSAVTIDGRPSLTQSTSSIGPEVDRTELVVHAPGRDSVDDGEEALAEVEQQDRVVVGLGRDHAARERSLVHAHARERRHPPRRAEDAGQRVQCVDRHVVERAPRRGGGSTSRDRSDRRPRAPARCRDSRRRRRRRSPSTGSRARPRRSGAGSPGCAGAASRRVRRRSSDSAPRRARSARSPPPRSSSSSC
jgi:hypothetical protein